MSDKNNSLHREFELERMVLFSDAVFAIAITLLIIEIKFPELPENYKESLNLFAMFEHTLIEFLGFFVSFFFIGMSWARHLKLFRYLKAYDGRVIVYNLLSLFFIVAFPFVASGITKVRPSFMFPMVIYLGNLMFMSLTNFLLSHYIFKQNPSLSMLGHEAEKIYIHKENQGSFFVLGIGFIIVVATAIISHLDNKAISNSFYALIILMVPMRLWLKKYKVKKSK